MLKAGLPGVAGVLVLPDLEPGLVLDLPVVVCFLLLLELPFFWFELGLEPPLPFEPEW